LTRQPSDLKSCAADARHNSAKQADLLPNLLPKKMQKAASAGTEPAETAKKKAVFCLKSFKISQKTAIWLR